MAQCCADDEASSVGSEVSERYLSSSPMRAARPREAYSMDPNTRREADIEGRHTIEIRHLVSSLQKIALHIPFRCTVVDMDCVSERRQGLRSSSLILDNVGDVINQAAWEEIKKVGAEEARLARECGDINSDGMPAITVIAEGAWSKRSYKNKKPKRKLPKKVPSTTPRSQGRVKEPHPGADVDYSMPDMKPDAMATASESFVKSLSLSITSIEDLQKATSKQSGSSLLKRERRKRLTAPLHGAMCKMKPTTGCGCTAGDIMYKKTTSEAIVYVKDHECVALKQLEIECKVVVKECALFVDQEDPFLGATPDDLISEDVLIEVKCPYSARGLTPLGGVHAKKNDMLHKNRGRQISAKVK
ncbi:hypothetical protein HPB51_003064 [Rhipicephalus microplus]|uniref:YqaJ viral recombinase domain-containing protein n=1 Tax=Rhipicephalus microplus TaxID=6941 RepID=A0A9J6D8J9_RHIMP|nr:hypothetical protein HPB51_003064 [Rhipicephalus microplus]